MASEYIPRKPGDLITAEDWNALQEKIQADIQQQVKKAMEEIIQQGVSRADNADQFNNQDSAAWIAQLDKRYAAQVHDHKDLKAYQRYFLELETALAGPSPRLQPAVIEHNMGRTPVVQVYELLELPIQKKNGEAFTDVPNQRFCFCGPEFADDEANKLVTKAPDERPWGDSLDEVVEELARGIEVSEREALKAKFSDDYTLGAWLDDITRDFFVPGLAPRYFNAGFKSPIYKTQWVKDRQKDKVSKLISDGEWRRGVQRSTSPRLVYRPRLVNAITLTKAAKTITSPGFQANDVVEIEICHLNMNEVEIWPASITDPMYLMVLLQT